MQQLHLFDPSIFNISTNLLFIFILIKLVKKGTISIRLNVSLGKTGSNRNRSYDQLIEIIKNGRYRRRR